MASSMDMKKREERLRILQKMRGEIPGQEEPAPGEEDGEADMQRSWQDMFGGSMGYGADMSQEQPAPGISPGSRERRRRRGV